MKVTKRNKYSGFTPLRPRLRRVKVTSSAFTIVELLVVIVVIAILAAITIVSFTGISQKAVAASLQSDLNNASKLLKMYYTEHGVYPASPLDNNCPTAPSTPDDKYCLKSSTGNRIEYSSINPYSTFSLTAYIEDTPNIYNVTNDSVPVIIPTVTIGTQTWMKYNLNVGTRVDGINEQTNNSIVEKYCHSNTESNCTTYGGLYQWNEAMQYVTTPGAQGICPANFHIPTDNDWKILELQLGMAPEEIDTIVWRGTDQGTQLKIGGTSGMNILLAGIRSTDGSFNYLSSLAYIWSSSESSVNAYYRRLVSNYTTVLRVTGTKTYGFSVRCVEN